MNILIDNVSFTATVLAHDIATTHMLVEFVPDDPDLMPMTLNVPVVERREWQPSVDGLAPIPNEYSLQDHIEYSVRCAAPVQQWRNQKILVNYLSSQA